MSSIIFLYQIERIALCPNKEYEAIKVRKLDNSEILYGYIKVSENCHKNDIVKLIDYDDSIESTLGEWELQNRNKLKHMFIKEISYKNYKEMITKNINKKLYS